MTTMTSGESLTRLVLRDCAKIICQHATLSESGKANINPELLGTMFSNSRRMEDGCAQLRQMVEEESSGILTIRQADPALFRFRRHTHQPHLYLVVCPCDEPEGMFTKFGIGELYSLNANQGLTREQPASRMQFDAHQAHQRLLAQRDEHRSQGASAAAQLERELHKAAKGLLEAAGRDAHVREWVMEILDQSKRLSLTNAAIMCAALDVNFQLFVADVAGGSFNASSYSLR